MNGRADPGADPAIPGGYRGMSALDWSRRLRQDALARRFESRGAEKGR